MNKFLVEGNWKSVAQKHKVKDTTLQQALASFAKVGTEKFEEKLKALERLEQLSNALKKSKDVMVNGEVGKYLAEVIKAVEAEKKQAVESNSKKLNETKAAKRGSEEAKRYIEG
jgi:hypothetical protein